MYPALLGSKYLVMCHRVLGPLFFLLFVNDLPISACLQTTQRFKLVSGAKCLQQNLDSLSFWSEKCNANWCTLRTHVDHRTLYVPLRYLTAFKRPVLTRSNRRNGFGCANHSRMSWSGASFHINLPSLPLPLLFLPFPHILLPSALPPLNPARESGGAL